MKRLTAEEVEIRRRFIDRIGSRVTRRRRRKKHFVGVGVDKVAADRLCQSTFSCKRHFAFLSTIFVSTIFVSTKDGEENGVKVGATVLSATPEEGGGGA